MEKANAGSTATCALNSLMASGESVELEGHYSVECRDADGNVKWTDTIKNLVTDVGKKALLDTFLGGSAYTVTGPFMGFINTNASAAAYADTMASHAGWLEVGGANAPAYTAPRKTISFSAAAGSAGSISKASSGTYTFAFTSAGTVGGCFLTLGSGAVSTIDSTAGTLYSAGAFSGGSKTVASGYSLSVTYSASA